VTATLPSEELDALLHQNIDRLAEAEHDGWMEHRERNGWRHGKPRDDALKLHPAMVPYAQLPEQEKGKDRNTIRHYPDFAAGADYRIVRLGKRDQPPSEAGSVLVGRRPIHSLVGDADGGLRRQHSGERSAPHSGKPCLALAARRMRFGMPSNRWNSTSVCMSAMSKSLV
jgi:hypothetical protein